MGSRAGGRGTPTRPRGPFREIARCRREKGLLVSPSTESPTRVIHPKGCTTMLEQPGVVSDAADLSPTDDDLLARVREGDSAAYDELWRRYSSLAVAVARRTTSRFDPEDLASEAFTRVLSAIRAGSGPRHAFRAYLITVVRNTSANWGSRQVEIPMADPYQVAASATTTDPDETLQGSWTATAFTSLPERMRTALWFTVVEGLTPTELGPVMGITANAAGVLAFRSREALRQAWIQAQLDNRELPARCVSVFAALGAYARQTLAPGKAQRVEKHLETCPACARDARTAAAINDELLGSARTH